VARRLPGCKAQGARRMPSAVREVRRKMVNLAYSAVGAIKEHRLRSRVQREEDGECVSCCADLLVPVVFHCSSISASTSTERAAALV
jgi:hypothetical protein